MQREMAAEWMYPDPGSAFLSPLALHLALLLPTPATPWLLKGASRSMPSIPLEFRCGQLNKGHSWMSEAYRGAHDVWITRGTATR